MVDSTKQEYSIGIDLGTTYSCLAIWMDNKVHIVPDEMGKLTMPSYVQITGAAPKAPVVGTAAKNSCMQKPTETLYDSKRVIGRKFDDPVVKADS